MPLNLSKNALNVLEKRYLKKQDGRPVETPEELFRRVADNIALVERSVYGHDEQFVDNLSAQFYEAMTSLEFIPNSPTLMNAGRELQQLAACFVLPVEDSMEGIFDSIKFAAKIHQSGGGTGFSFSRLRPKNDEVRTTGGVASGPISFMKVFNAATDAVKQGGTRRGANMGILRVDHPDILEFINAKESNSELANFNISVALTETFMEALRRDGEYELINPRSGKPVTTLRAREVFDLIVDAAWRNGEPGVIFIDRLNADNPTPLVGEIESTNPCGEQPLLPYEACNLGSLNLAKMITTRDGEAEVDWDRLERATRLSVRFLDNVIDASHYPLPVIDEMVKSNRKIGLGVMGFADLLILLGVRYDSPEAVGLAGDLMGFIQKTARDESQALAEERGPFPNFKGSIYDVPGARSVRNATTTTVAPTGTISIIAGCSSGIEPLFAICFVRHVLDNAKLVEVNPLFEEFARREGFFTPQLMELIAEKGSLAEIPEVPERIRQLFVTAQEITPDWHIEIQSAFQEYTDNAVSKTINFHNKATREDVATAYLLAYEKGCKGVTVYRDGSREVQVLTAGTGKAKEGGDPAGQVAEGLASAEQPREVAPRPRPEVTTGTTEKVQVGCGNLYVSVNADEYGVCEIFTNTGREGGCSSQSEATSRLISIALRSGISVDTIYEQLRGIRCPACLRRNGVHVTSCPDAIGKAIKKYVERNGGSFQPGLPFSRLSVPRANQNFPGAKASEARAQSDPAETIRSCEEQTPVEHEAAVASDDFHTAIAKNHCPECGHELNHESGCIICVACGYSKCG